MTIFKRSTVLDTFGRKSMDNWIIILVLSCVLITVLVIFINYRRTQKTMDTIEQMLDAAADGTYSESNFDESRLSALETKYAHY